MATVHLPNGRTDSYTTQVGGTVLAFVDGVARADALPEGVARFLKINGYKVSDAGKSAKESTTPGEITKSRTLDAANPDDAEALAGLVAEGEATPITVDNGPDGPTKTDAKPKTTRAKADAEADDAKAKPKATRTKPADK